MVTMYDTDRKGTLSGLDPTETVVDAEYNHAVHLLSGDIILFPGR